MTAAHIMGLPRSRSVSRHATERLRGRLLPIQKYVAKCSHKCSQVFDRIQDNSSEDLKHFVSNLLHELPDFHQLIRFEFRDLTARS